MIKISTLIEAANAISHNENQIHERLRLEVIADLKAFQRELIQHETADNKFSVFRLSPAAVHSRAHEILDKLIGINAIHRESIGVFLKNEIQIICKDHRPHMLRVISGAVK